VAGAVPNSAYRTLGTAVLISPWSSHNPLSTHFPSWSLLLRIETNLSALEDWYRNQRKSTEHMTVFLDWDML
jgi:hypothetical protein